MKTLLFSLFPIYLFSQNLVVNPSFEEGNTSVTTTSCTPTYTSDDFNKEMITWKTLRLSTPDIYYNVKNNPSCYPIEAQEGKKHIGFINYLPQFDTRQAYDYHEFLQGQLSQPLQPGKKYRIQFYLLQHDTLAMHHVKTIYRPATPALPMSSNNIGIYFSTRDLSQVMMNKATNFKPQLNKSEIIAPKAGQWQLYDWDFVADQPYRYFIIGNFFTDEATQINKPEEAAKVLEKTVTKSGLPVQSLYLTKRIAYYCLDNVSIIPESTIHKVLITESKPFIFEKVLFNTGKSTLLPGAEEELTALANYIKDNPTKYFEIGGHTDNVGDDAANQLLSEKRAKTVYDYLINLGVNNNQLSYKGYGETVSKASNDKPEGRKENRRVECNIMKNEK